MHKRDVQNINQIESSISQVLSFDQTSARDAAKHSMQVTGQLCIDKPLIMQVINMTSVLAFGKRFPIFIMSF